MKIHVVASSIIAIGVLAACSSEAERPESNMAETPATAETSATPQTIALNGGDGRPVGSVTLTEDTTGVAMKLDASAIAAGMHGLHLHEKGLCEGPKFESAGAHWNPTNKKHGRDNPEGVHLGDLANLEVPASGTASISLQVTGVLVGSGVNPLADADGTSLVVHAKADDYKTDPSGNSGDRVACAVIAPATGG